MVMMMMAIMMMEGLFPINHAPDVPKLLNMARDGDCPLLIKTILFLSLLQQLHEQWVIEIHHRHHKSLLLLSLSHLYRQTPFRHISRLLFPRPLVMLMMMVMKMR